MQSRKTWVPAAVAAALLAGAAPAEAAPRHLEFTVHVDSGSLAGNSYQGGFEFDDAPLTGLGNESVYVDALSFGFDGSLFSQADGTVPPTVDFLDGVFLGLNFDVGLSHSSIPFAFIAGFFDAAEASFNYDPGLFGSAGGGTVTYTPEPASLALLAIGMAGFRIGRRGKA